MFHNICGVTCFAFLHILCIIHEMCYITNQFNYSCGRFCWWDNKGLFPFSQSIYRLGCLSGILGRSLTRHSVLVYSVFVLFSLAHYLPPCTLSGDRHTHLIFEGWGGKPFILFTYQDMHDQSVMVVFLKAALFSLRYLLHCFNRPFRLQILLWCIHYRDA